MKFANQFFGQPTMCMADSIPLISRHILCDKPASQSEGKSVEQISNTIPIERVRMSENQKWYQNSGVVAIKFKIDAR